MSVDKINFLNTFKNSSLNRKEKSDHIIGSNLKQNDTVASVNAAKALKSLKFGQQNDYTFLQKVNIPSLNLNGNLYMLKNGQKCFVAKKDGPCAIKTFFNVGSMNETSNIRGISHYIEHNLFNGTKELKAGEFFNRVNKLGASTNASTSFSTTDFYISSQLLKEKDLEDKLRLHSDMLQNPVFAPDMLDKERGERTVVIQSLSCV